MRIYNTLSGKKEEFEPINPDQVGMYVCGVTVYDYCHVGHARAYISFDAIYRYLCYKGYKVDYVRNFTDIDDKIIRRSNELGLPFKEISERYINAFHEDMATMKMKEATTEPRATEHIGDIIDMIQKLIDNGYAYAVDGDVYYAVEQFESYGKLSRRKLEDLISGVRIDSQSNKRNALDFALWKSVKPGEPNWESPWGTGRPGWHIECSVMSTKYLGSTFDIHGGGKDLVFPHHENEIAQSEGATGKPYVKYWMHNGFVNIDGAKMSKSLGNFFTIRNLLDLYHPEVIRFFVLSNHYRSPINFKVKRYECGGEERVRFISLDDAEERLYHIYETLNKMDKIIDAPGKSGVNLDEEMTQSVLKQFESIMDDDFNTAGALGELSKVIHFVNDVLSRKTKMKNKKATFEVLRPQLKQIGTILGVFDSEPADFLETILEKRLKEFGIDRKDILDLIEQRNAARKERDFDESDRIRQKLFDMGIQINDCPDGVEWCCNKTV